MMMMMMMMILTIICQPFAGECRTWIKVSIFQGRYAGVQEQDILRNESRDASRPRFKSRELQVR